MADRREKDAAGPWLEKTESDLRSAEVLLSLDPPRTHDLVALLDLLVPGRPRLEALYEPAEVLAPYAVQVRYPFVSDPPTDQEAQAALQAARTVAEVVREVVAAMDE